MTGVKSESWPSQPATSISPKDGASSWPGRKLVCGRRWTASPTNMTASSPQRSKSKARSMPFTATWSQVKQHMLEVSPISPRPPRPACTASSAQPGRPPGTPWISSSVSLPPPLSTLLKGFIARTILMSCCVHYLYCEYLLILASCFAAQHFGRKRSPVDGISPPGPARPEGRLVAPGNRRGSSAAANALALS